MLSAASGSQGAPGIASELWNNFLPHMLVAAYCVAAYRQNERAPCRALHSREPQSSCATSLSLGLPLTCNASIPRPPSVFLRRSPGPRGSSVGGFHQSKRLWHSELVSSLLIGWKLSTYLSFTAYHSRNTPEFLFKLLCLTSILPQGLLAPPFHKILVFISLYDLPEVVSDSLNGGSAEYINI